jgi:hypothetical protein
MENSGLVIDTMTSERLLSMFGQDYCSVAFLGRPPFFPPERVLRIADVRLAHSDLIWASVARVRACSMISLVMRGFHS